jgi:hypothetical protein
MNVHLVPLCAVPGVSEYYQTPVTNFTYYLNTSYVGWQEAEGMCKRNGAHLANYKSWEEQVGPGDGFRASAYAACLFICLSARLSVTPHWLLQEEPRTSSAKQELHKVASPGSRNTHTWHTCLPS